MWYPLSTLCSHDFSGKSYRVSLFPQASSGILLCCWVFSLPDSLRLYQEILKISTLLILIISLFPFWLWRGTHVTFHTQKGPPPISLIKKSCFPKTNSYTSTFCLNLMLNIGLPIFSFFSLSGVFMSLFCSWNAADPIIQRIFPYCCIWNNTNFVLCGLF